MIWAPKVKISNQTYVNYKPIMYYFRLCGLFPFTVHKSRWHLFLTFSPLCLVISWIVTAFCVFMAYYGIMLDSHSKTESIKIAYDTDELLMLMAITGFCSICLAGAFINPCMFSKFFGYIKCVTETDWIIKTTYTKWDKLKILSIVSFTLISNVALIWFYLSGCYKIYGESLGLLGVLKRYLGLNLVAGISYISEFTNLILLNSLEKRIRRLNQILELQYLKAKNTCVFGDKSYDIIIKQLNKSFLKIMDAAAMLDQLLGVFTLITILAVFCSLIQNPYFFLLALSGRRGVTRNGIELVETSVDLFFHITRVFLIIEPPYACLIEIEKTKSFICKLLTCNMNPKGKRQVKMFAVILGLRQLRFSPCGLFSVDRFLFTSLLDTIVTLLVVLLQYRDELRINW